MNTELATFTASLSYHIGNTFADAYANEDFAAAYEQAVTEWEQGVKWHNPFTAPSEEYDGYSVATYEIKMFILSRKHHQY